jgi:hypothetical protein
VTSIVFNFRVMGVGPICRVEVNNTMHSGSRTHNQALVNEDDPRQNPGTKTFGRAGFLIDGDNARRNNFASEGCIILNRGARNQIESSGINLLMVVP